MATATGKIAEMLDRQVLSVLEGLLAGLSACPAEDVRAAIESRSEEDVFELAGLGGEQREFLAAALYELGPSCTVSDEARRRPE